MSVRRTAERALLALERVLDEDAPGWSESAALAERARSLSKGFTEDRQMRETPTLDALGKNAYLAYFAPRTIAALAQVYARLSPPTAIAMDVGAGTGASGLFLALMGVRILHLVDKDERALSRARALINRVAPSTEVVVHPGTRIPDLRVGDLTLSFSLSEIALGDDDARTTEYKRVLERHYTRLVIVDGGDRTAARNVQHLRAEAIAMGLGVLFPCPHDDVCPALARTGDWCHLRTERGLTTRLAQFATRVGRDPEQMAYMALVASREHPTTVSDDILVLGTPQVEKGRTRIAVCGRDGLRTLQALKRHASVALDLAALPLGSMVRAHGERRADTLHLDSAPVVVES
jgi:predicted O-methyltransferase YrrM